ncbi:unnamed protein product, partial [Medioppia subpectinata]
YVQRQWIQLGLRQSGDEFENLKANSGVVQYHSFKVGGNDTGYGQRMDGYNRPQTTLYEAANLISCCGTPYHNSETKSHNSIHNKKNSILPNLLIRRESHRL